MDIENFWNTVISQNRNALPLYFNDDAIIRWHCSNEEFTVEEYIKANCEYPGNWLGEIENIENVGDTVILAGRVYPADRSCSFHVVSLFTLTRTAKSARWMNIGLMMAKHQIGASR